MPKQDHRLTFSTRERAGCVCGYVALRTSHESARRTLIRHITNPGAPGKIADTPAEHARCVVEQWNVKWGVCRDHNVYIDLEARGVDVDQTELPLTYVSQHEAL